MRILALGFALFLVMSIGVSAIQSPGVPCRIDSRPGYCVFGTDYGWNLFSVPVQGGQVSFTSNENCVFSPVWHWDGTQYLRVGSPNQLLTLEPRKAYWVKMEQPSDINRQCGSENIHGIIGGTLATEFNNYALHAGWNMVGGLNEAVAFNDIKAGCQVKSGPWKHNSHTNQYEKSLTLERYAGYWIKVSEACALHSGPTIYNG